MKKAGLRTGARGISLIETLLAVTILSSGIVLIVPALFRSGGILGHLVHQYTAERLASNLIAEKEEDLRSLRPLDSRFLKGKLQSGETSYTYEIDTAKQDRAGRLHLLTVHIHWRDYKTGEVTRSAYILQ